MRQASGITEQGPARPEAGIVRGLSGVCVECGERVEPWHEALEGTDGDPLMHAEHAEEADDE